MRKVILTIDAYETIDGNSFSNEALAIIHENNLIMDLKSYITMIEFNYDYNSSSFLEKIMIVSPEIKAIDLKLDQLNINRLTKVGKEYFNNIKITQFSGPSRIEINSITMQDIIDRKENIEQYRIENNIGKNDVFYFNRSLKRKYYE